MLCWVANLGCGASGAIFTVIIVAIDASVPRTTLTCFRGDTASWTFTVERGGGPFDLTGSKVWMTARRGCGGTQIFQLSSPASGIIIDPDQTANKGKCTAMLDNTSTAGLASEVLTLYFDIQVLSSIGELWTVAYGDLVVTPDATSEIS